MVEVPEVGAFLLGAPKCGTTWLAEILTQHPEICVSDPKEPNIVASHKGTFGRDDSVPDWVTYSDCFNGEGLRIDCSVHAMACPVGCQNDGLICAPQPIGCQPFLEDSPARALGTNYRLFR